MILSKAKFHESSLLYKNHKQLPSQESKPRPHLYYFKSVLLHLCRHHVLVVILQTISYILKDILKALFHPLGLEQSEIMYF